MVVHNIKRRRQRAPLITPQCDQATSDSNWVYKRGRGMSYTSNVCIVCCMSSSWNVTITVRFRKVRVLYMLVRTCIILWKQEATSSIWNVAMSATMARRAKIYFDLFSFAFSETVTLMRCLNWQDCFIVFSVIIHRKCCDHCNKQCGECFYGHVVWLTRLFFSGSV